MSEREVTKTAKGREYQVTLLKADAKRLRKNLNNQIKLFEDLLATRDVKTVKQELSKLNSIFVDLGGVSGRLCELVTEDESEQLSSMVIAEGESINKIETAVSEWLKAQDTPNRSQKSRASTHSERSSKSKLSLVT